MIYDVAIVGGGHAGYEAAAAACRLGCTTILLTMESAKIGTLSCNPAIGGTAKGHLVKEIDALGGIMGHVTDSVGIQFRILNRSRGPAVWSPRAQVDRHRYPREVQSSLRLHKNLEIASANVTKILVRNNRICGIVTSDGSTIHCKTAVLTCGTFLNGRIHIGMKNLPAGRYDEAAAVGITESLVSFGFESGRLKTGTPPRIHRDSIDFSTLEPQFGDTNPEPFSWSTKHIENVQIPCHLTYTNSTTHDILRGGFEHSPMFTGRIVGVGPRYCPSIEDKINRFADKDRHQIFLEPEGYDNPEYYVNGFSTSLPAEIQEVALKTVPGLSNVQVLRPGYAVEYDFFPPHQINRSMETKNVAGLFLAGQINGTSGYEEAGAQGLMAGINAALQVRDKEPLILQRNEAYVGVLIDDLVNKSTLEPYRIFTSLAEHRLLLRYDNADLRLTDKAHQLGLVTDAQHDKLHIKKERMIEISAWAGSTNVNPDVINTLLRESDSAPIVEPVSIETLLRRPGVSLSRIVTLLDPEGINSAEFNDAIREIDTSIKYAGYIAKQNEMVQKFEKLESKRIPVSFQFSSIKTLSKEAKEKLSKVKPENLGQASRVSGVTPADIAILMVYLERPSS